MSTCSSGKGSDEGRKAFSAKRNKTIESLPPEILAEVGVDARVRALLIEHNAELLARAREAAALSGLIDVRFMLADAALTATYANVPSAHILVVSGVFGNISAEDVQRTIAALPSLLAVGGLVIWTRAVGRRPGHDSGEEVRSWLTKSHFMEVSTIKTVDDFFWVGMHKLPREDRRLPAPSRDARLFSFR